jgi:hypothetical protein
MKKVFLFLAILFLMTSCSDAQRGNFFMFQNTQPTEPCIGKSIGDTFGGGKIAYFFQVGDPGYIAGECHGIIARLSDTGGGAFMWDFNSSPYVLTNATLNALGSGHTNTITITNAIGYGIYAAYLCLGTNNGYSDWVLPTSSELLKLEANQVIVGGFDNTAAYWSSTEVYQSHAYAVSFVDGSTSSVEKNAFQKVRPIRYF